MGKFASEVVAQAEMWLGAKQYDSVHKEIINIYNNHRPLARNYTMKLSDYWCACFVSSVSIKLGYTDIIPTEVSCPKMIELFKGMGIWIENENVVPKEGWICLYDWDDNGVGDNVGGADHIGIVSEVSGNTFKVIEGNMGYGYVGKRSLEVNGKYLRGFAVPKYDLESNTTVKVENEQAQVNEKEEITGRNAFGQKGPNPQLKFYENSVQIVKDLQRILKKRGYNLLIDGYAGPVTYKAVTNYTVESGEKHDLVGWVQKKLNDLGYNSGNVDNYAGPITMAAIYAFQKDYGLGVGYLGGTDWYYLLTL